MTRPATIEVTNFNYRSGLNSCQNAGLWLVIAAPQPVDVLGFRLGRHGRRPGGMTMRHLGSAGLALAFVLCGCGGSGDGNKAAAGNNQAAAASSDSAATGSNAAASAPAGNSSAGSETAAGPCPFETRNWRATLFPASPGEQAVVAVITEVRPDASGRMPAMSTQSERRAPTLIVELVSDPRYPVQANREWQQSSVVFDRHTPDFTEAAVRCGGVEIARVPVRPE